MRGLDELGTVELGFWEARDKCRIADSEQSSFNSLYIDERPLKPSIWEELRPSVRHRYACLWLCRLRIMVAAQLKAQHGSRLRVLDAVAAGR